MLALLDVDLSNTVSLKEWVEGIRASTDSLDAVASAFTYMLAGGMGGGAGGAGVSRAQRAVLTVLAAVSAQVAADLEVFWAAYARADKDGGACLLRSLTPDAVRCGPISRMVAFPAGNPSEVVGTVSCLAWSPDGGRLAVIGEQGAVRLWDTAAVDSRGDTAAVALLTGGSGSSSGSSSNASSPVCSLSWSPCGHQLAAGCEDRAMRVWELGPRRAGAGDAGADAPVVLLLEGHLHSVESVVFHPRAGGRLVSGSADKTVRLWRRRGG